MNRYGDKLEGRIVLVTGGGQGLGAAIVRVLSGNGARLIIGDINPANADLLMQEVNTSGGAAEALLLDVSNRTSVSETLDAIQKRYGRLDAVINNAGIDVTKAMLEMTEDEWERVVRVNLFGPFFVSKKSLSIMAGQGSGHIINIVSTAAKRAWANASAYHASKWGLLGLSHATFAEARALNVKVTALVSGGLRTPFIMDRFPDTPLDVLQDPVNVAETIAFILSMPPESVVPEIMVIPMKETSWP